MLKLKLLSRHILLGTVFSLSLGCTESTKTTRITPATEPDVRVTVNKPVMTGNRESSDSINRDKAVSSENIDRTNTGINARDRNNTEKTPLDQSESNSDIRITADIRSRVVDTKMSVDAQNVKIITQNGKVTLRGPVHTADEKAQVEQIAMDVAGADKVDSKLEIASN